MITLTGLALLAGVMIYYAGRSHWKAKIQDKSWKDGYWDGYRQGYADCGDDKQYLMPRDMKSVSLKLTKIQSSEDRPQQWILGPQGGWILNPAWEEYCNKQSK